MNPAISVVLPVFNAVAYVEAAVQSVLEQTFENFELILIDDGSTDASGDILRKLAARDTRVRLIQRENRGLIATLNEGVTMARAPFVARMDADDISLPCRLALQFERMCADPSLVVLGGAIRYLDAAGRLGRTVVYPTGEKIETAILWGAPVAHPATMFRTEAGRRVGGYSHLFAHAEDYALWLQLRNSGKVDNLPQTVLHYRVHGQSTSHMHALSQRTSTLRAQALWLAGVQPSPALIDIPSNLDFLESLPLLQQTRVDILARMLALSPHIIGDEFVDTETSQWLQIVLGTAQTPTLRQGRAWFHLRAARLYPKMALRRLRHLCQAVLASPRACMALFCKRFDC